MNTTTPQTSVKSDLHLQDAISAFLAPYSNIKTKSSYSGILYKLTYWVGSMRRVHRITLDDLTDFIRDLATIEHFATTTIAKYSRVIRLFFSWLVDMHYLKESPAAMLPYAITAGQPAMLYLYK